jgi:hypothetical protein
MTTRKDITNAVWEKANEIAKDMDCSRLDAQTLHTMVMLSFEHVDYINREIFEWAARVTNEPPIMDDPKLVKRCTDIAWDAVPVVVFFLTVRLAAIREIEARSTLSKTNYYFGLLELAQDLGIVQLQKWARRNLHRILSAIPRKMGWRHPDGEDSWLEVIDLTIAQLLKEHVLDAPSTVQAMAENRFAKVYWRVRSRLVDEVRRLLRRPKELPLRDVAVSRSPADESLQRLDVIKLVQEAAKRCGEEHARKEILQQLEAMLENPELADGSPREIGAHVVRHIVQNRGVSEQQARRDLRDFQDFARAEKTMQVIQDEIRALSKFRIVLKQVELERIPEESSEDS